MSRRRLAIALLSPLAAAVVALSLRPSAAAAIAVGAGLAAAIGVLGTWIAARPAADMWAAARQALIAAGVRLAGGFAGALALAVLLPEHGRIAAIVAGLGLAVGVVADALLGQPAEPAGA